MGGFNGTSNVGASCVFDLPVKGTHAHSFVTSFTCMEEITRKTIKDNFAVKDGEEEKDHQHDFVEVQA